MRTLWNNKVAIFGGSFNPPHLGHLMAAVYVLATEDVEEVWFEPTYKHALGKELADYEHRYQMVYEMAEVLGNRAQACRDELFLSKEPGYKDSRTINLTRYLKKEYPNYGFRTIIGSDLVEQSKTWDDWEEVCKLAPPIVVPRKGHASMEAMSIPGISSSIIREYIKAGKSITHLVPLNVANHIHDMGLYKPMALCECGRDTVIDMVNRLCLNCIKGK